MNSPKHVLFLVAPVCWFSFPLTLKAYLDHWRNGDRAKAQPMIDSTAMCAKFLDMGGCFGAKAGRRRW